MQWSVPATGIGSLALRYKRELACVTLIARHCDVASATASGNWDDFHLHLDSMCKINVSGNRQTEGWRTGSFYHMWILPVRR